MMKQDELLAFLQKAVNEVAKSLRFQSQLKRNVLRI